MKICKNVKKIKKKKKKNIKKNVKLCQSSRKGTCPQEIEQ